MPFALATTMGIGRQVMQYGQRRFTRKLFRAVPFLGAVVAGATLTRAMRRKGMWGGTMDTVLDFVPFVGAAKNTAEIVRGRDFFPDRVPTRR
jgi:hypothetical protein